MPARINLRTRQSRLRLEKLEDRIQPTVYAITDLGLVNGVALNNNGAVAGTFVNSSDQSVGFIYQNGTMSDLTGLDGNVAVFGINDSNQVTGRDGNGSFLWASGNRTGVPIGGAIADNGTIAGGYDPAEVDVNGTVSALPPSGVLTEDQAISVNGQYVAGWILGGVTGESAPAVWNLATGQATVLNDDTMGQSLGANNSGEVVGQTEQDSGGVAFLYDNGQFNTNLGTLAGGINSSANAINDEGVVVGNMANGDGFVYSNGVLTDLNQLVPAGAGFTVESAIAVNDSGQILATTSNGHTILLNPVASPTFTLSGFPSTTTAGVAHNLTVTVLNPNGTVDVSYTGTVHFTSTDPEAVLPSNYTFTAADAGVHTFSITLKQSTFNSASGGQTITVTDTSNSGISTAQSGITVNPAAATHFAVFASSTNVRPGQAFTIIVQAYDAYGNLAIGYTGTIHFSDSVRGALLPANYTFTAADEGSHAFISGAKLQTRGEQTITVSDTENPSIDGTIEIDVI